MNISESIRQVRDEFVNTGLAESYYRINCGLCEDLAIEVLQRVTGEKAHLYDVSNEQFVDEDTDQWDFSLLSKHWGVKPPKGLKKSDLNEIRFGGHVWIADYKEKRFYDAEAPDGVDNFFDLPIFRRCIVSYLRKKGISAPDVVTEDVLPAPKCSIPDTGLEVIP